MSLITKEAMVRKFKYLTNTTKTAIERRLPQKEVTCIICGKVITGEELDKDEIECTADKGIFRFFHKSCMHMNQ